MVSLCEPQVPCGAVTAELLGAAGVEAAPDSLERDVRAVLTRLSLGEADAGVVYRTDAVAAGTGVEVVEVPGADAVRHRLPRRRARRHHRPGPGPGLPRPADRADGPRRARRGRLRAPVSRSDRPTRRPARPTLRPARPALRPARPAPARPRAVAGTGLPWPLGVLAALGLAVLVLPLLALVVRAPWRRLPALVVAPESTQALALSLGTAALSTLLCLLLGVPLAWVLARVRRARPGAAAGPGHRAARAAARSWAAWACCCCSAGGGCSGSTSTCGSACGCRSPPPPSCSPRSSCRCRSSSSRSRGRCAVRTAATRRSRRRSAPRGGASSARSPCRWWRPASWRARCSASPGRSASSAPR